MRPSSARRREKFDFTRIEISDRIGGFVRRLHPDRTVDNVAADLAPWGIKAETIAAMLQRQTTPGTMLWLALIWAYGPDFLAEVHPAPLGWLRPALREQEVADVRRDLAAIQARLDRLA